ncbi:MAG: ABC transporter permease [Paenibacillus sp. RIFOXYA1_FULL_44_5]|nr:MAG: ABC transporter permease [Paenibacillus sp. RIFOXYA1_FULL_44_5]
MFNMLSYKVQKKLILIVFLTLPIVLLCTFSLYPALNLIYLSFTSWDGIDSVKHWIGWGNYKEVFQNPQIFKVFPHHLAYLVVGIVQNIVALYFAVLLNTKFRGRRFFRLMLFLPYILNGVAVAFMFGYVFDTTNGSLNYLLQFLGLEKEPVSWLGGKTLVNYSLASIGLWRFMGFNMVIYLGALQSIPEDIYEAATLDGANRFQTFMQITLPNMLKIIEVNLFLTVNGALSVFDLPFVLTQGGPAGASTTYVMKTLETAFQFNNYGLASAMSVVLLLAIVIVLSTQSFVLNRKEN